MLLEPKLSEASQSLKLIQKKLDDVTFTNYKD